MNGGPSTKATNQQTKDALHTRSGTMIRNETPPSTSRAHPGTGSLQHWEASKTPSHLSGKDNLRSAENREGVT